MMAKPKPLGASLLTFSRCIAAQMRIRAALDINPAETIEFLTDLIATILRICVVHSKPALGDILINRTGTNGLAVAPD
ncbi:hypothetical protein XH84_30745 [Bradyrhizobium nanningense]|nr:hypothetical protein XH84_30745 [Bradyrhizobium nanningense]